MPPYLAKIISSTEHICKVHHIITPYLRGLKDNDLRLGPALLSLGCTKFKWTTTLIKDMVGLLPNGRSPRSSRVDQQPWVHVDEKVSGLQEFSFFFFFCSLWAKCRFGSDTIWKLMRDYIIIEWWVKARKRKQKIFDDYILY